MANFGRKLKLARAHISEPYESPRTLPYTVAPSWGTVGSFGHLRAGSLAFDHSNFAFHNLLVRALGGSQIAGDRFRIYDVTNATQILSASYNLNETLFLWATADGRGTGDAGPGPSYPAGDAEFILQYQMGAGWSSRDLTFYWAVLDILWDY